MKRNVLASAFLIASIMISGCSKTEETKVIDQTEPIESSVETDEKEEEQKVEVAAPYTYPLTGLGTDEEQSRRVVAVTINNAPAARPQSGVIDADIVYEILAEYEVTRFIALYHSKQPEKIGPIRSSRPYHIDLANGYNGMYVAHGFSPEAERLLKNGAIDNINGIYDRGFSRSSERKAPHNSYISFNNIIEGLDSKGYQLDGDVPELLFKENDDVKIQGETGTNINISYFNINRVSYVFDENSGYYHRFNDEKQTIDHEQGSPL